MVQNDSFVWQNIVDIVDIWSYHISSDNESTTALLNNEDRQRGRQVSL